MAINITDISRGRVILLDGRRIDFDRAEMRPANEGFGCPAHLRITHRDGALRMIFWPAIAEIVEDKET